MNTNLKMLWVAALFSLVSGGSLAGPVGPLTTFTAGTPARAADVNGNFTAVKTAVDDNDRRVSVNAAAIATNTQAIVGIQARIEGACTAGFTRIGLWCLDTDGIADGGTFIRSTTSIENNSGSTATNLDTLLGLPGGIVKAAVVRTVIQEIANASSATGHACVSSRPLSMSVFLSCTGAAIDTGLIVGLQAMPTQVGHVVPVDGDGNLHTFCVWGRTAEGQAFCRWTVMGYIE